jgi:hypothetical protein
MRGVTVFKMKKRAMAGTPWARHGVIKDEEAGDAPRI